MQKTIVEVPSSKTIKEGDENPKSDNIQDLSMKKYDEIQINLDDAVDSLRDYSQNHGTAPIGGLATSEMVSLPSFHASARNE